jgi:sporulation-control protein spo0M
MEAHIPLTNGQIPVVIQGGGDITLKLDATALQRLMKDGHVKLHRTDDETHIAVRKEVA